MASKRTTGSGRRKRRDGGPRQGIAEADLPQFDVDDETAPPKRPPATPVPRPPTRHPGDEVPARLPQQVEERFSVT